jgi:GTP cyclohydrolase I
MRLPDIQDQPDVRGIELDSVGIAGLRYPVTFNDGAVRQQAIATVAITVRLPAHRRGTHMSRMVEITHDHLQDLDPRTLTTTLKAVGHRLDASGVAIRLAMPVATRVTAPVSGATAWQTHDLELTGRLDADVFTLDTTLTSEVTSLCPCSKAISDYGAHNQRSRISLTVTGTGDAPYPLPVNEAVEMIRGVGSCPVYPVVKRPDERDLTMYAHDHPAFVEDIARDLSLGCRARGLQHSVQVVNIESIHSHDAIASVAWRPA